MTSLGLFVVYVDTTEHGCDLEYFMLDIERNDTSFDFMLCESCFLKFNFLMHYSDQLDTSIHNFLLEYIAFGHKKECFTVDFTKYLDTVKDTKAMGLMEYWQPSMDSWKAYFKEIAI